MTARLRSASAAVSAVTASATMSALAARLSSSEAPRTATKYGLRPASSMMSVASDWRLEVATASGTPRACRSPISSAIPGKTGAWSIRSW